MSGRTKPRPDGAAVASTFYAGAPIRHADKALYRAKASGKNTYQYFSATPEGGARADAVRHAVQGREGSLI